LRKSASLLTNKAKLDVTCPICNSPMTLKSYTRETRVGRRVVRDGSMKAQQCERCGAVDLSEEQVAGYERRAARTVLLESDQVGGAEIRFARKALGLRQTDLAAALGCNPQQISRYENDDKVDMWLRLAIAALLDRVERGESLETLGKDTRDLRLSA
jgi:putative zinc finger/helix-turn-helix YgiT family protein